MCKTIAEGGQRCAAHTRGKAVEALSTLRDKGLEACGDKEFEALAHYASTPRGRIDLEAISAAAVTAGYPEAAGLIDSAIARGDAEREANKHTHQMRVTEASDPSCPIEELAAYVDDADQAVRLAAVMNPNTPAWMRRAAAKSERMFPELANILARDPDLGIRVTLAGSITDSAGLAAWKTLARDKDPEVRHALVSNRRLTKSVKKRIASDPDPNVRSVLVLETPEPELLSLLALDACAAVRAAVPESVRLHSGNIRSKTREKYNRIVTQLSYDVDDGVRAATVASGALSSEREKEMLEEDRSPLVRLAYLKRMGTADPAMVKRLSRDMDPTVRAAAARHAALPRRDRVHMSAFDPNPKVQEIAAMYLETEYARQEFRAKFIAESSEDQRNSGGLDEDLSGDSMLRVTRRLQDEGRLP